MIIAVSALWLVTKSPSGPSLAANSDAERPDGDRGGAVPSSSTTPSPARSTRKSTPKPTASGTDGSPSRPKTSSGTGGETSPGAVTSPRAGASPRSESAPGPEATTPQRPRTGTATAPSPADAPPRAGLTPKEAYGIHARYQRRLSAAQVAKDRNAMAGLEHGLALEMTRASFTTAKMQGTSLASGMWPNPKVWIPRRVEGVADWFVAVAHEPGVARIADVMSSAPGGWRLVASAADTRPTPARFPEIATDADGYATGLPENATGLVATPRQIAGAHLASLERAEVDPAFEDGPWTGEAVLFWQRERERLREADWKLTLSYRLEGPVHALRTGDGGALVWYGARSIELREAVRKGATVKLKGSAAVRTRGKAFANSVSATYGRMYVTHVPPAGSNEPARVLGEWSDVLESHGD
ncbi:hypothetical protein ACLQ2R_04810 [Streptosporangium sp. DT93]|uniref:hypothetical protein n=1 Tax=Streptosporangium sp. DT93 TaxID=3393428 RepID=UPI003CF86143